MAPVKPKYQTLAGRDDDNKNNNNNAVVVNDDDSSKPAEPPIEVIILDFTHTRFTVPLAAGLASTVADLKVAGARHHSVSANQQRLIFQGKLLSDENATVQQCGIHHGSIVHLFPKPRVVVTNSSNSAPTSHTNEQAAASHQENNSSGRVPTIVVDEAEHARRGHILVLGSADYMEAVNNVKLFSFMLLIISTIELLNLVAVALGEGTVGDPSRSSSGLPTNDVIPYIEHDDFFPSEDDATAIPTDDGSGNNSNNGGFDNGTTNTDGTNMFNPYQTWSSLSWVDLVVSVLGIYVALLGVRASNDNVLSIARLYLVGTVITGVGWLVYNFIINFEIDEMAREQQQGGNNNNNNDPYHPSMPPSSPLNGNGANSDSVFNQAVQAMILPAVVWGLCIFRAWQFQHLLAEAELEALERIQSEEEQEGEENDGNDEEQALQQQQQQQPPPLPNRLASVPVSPPAPLPTIS
jgi:Ubiquitin family